MSNNRDESNPDISCAWYALRVKSHNERQVALIARNKGFEEFLPMYQSRRRWSDRYKSLELPLFPGYVFCRLNPIHRLPLLTIPGVVNLVGIGKTPAPVDPAEIAAVRAAVESGLAAMPWPFLTIGQRVRLEDGPLAGMEGLLAEVKNQHRLVVSLTLLHRSVAVQIDRGWVRPLPPINKQLISSDTSLSGTSWAAV